MKSWQSILLGVLFGLLAAGLVLLVATRPVQSGVTVLHPTKSTTITVHVDGAVIDPGLYEIPLGSRIDDAIDAAGGLSVSADTTSVNYAAVISDGEKILIPSRTTPTSEPEVVASVVGLVNLNTASIEELDALPGIGPAKAAAIVNYRQTYGLFTEVSDLLYVPGIGQSILDTIYDYVTVNP